MQITAAKLIALTAPSPSQVEIKGSLSHPAQRLFGFLNRKERWGLSWRGWLALIFGIFFTGGVWVVTIHPFLAPTQRIPTDVLVVEGWVHPFSIEAAVKEFKQGHYSKIYVTGGPDVGSGHYTTDSVTTAHVGTSRLIEAGISERFVQMVVSHEMDRDRTYAAATALRNWFQEHNLQVHSLNVLTEDAHARRTWLLFQEALGTDTKVGIISVPNPDYDPSRWWNCSDGVREVIGESLAYFYARFLFWPKQDHRDG